jgi:acyl carrier protein
MVTREEVFNRVCGALSELFELDAKTVTLETKLVDDLGLDSIDAIDLAARLEELTKKRLAEEGLRSLRTVGDVVDLIVGMVSDPSSEASEAASGPRSLQETPEGS